MKKVRWSLKCLSLGCSSTNLTPGITMKPFPKPWLDPMKCMRWLTLIGREDLNASAIGKNSYVCSLHFEDGDPEPHLACQRPVVVCPFTSIASTVPVATTITTSAAGSSSTSTTVSASISYFIVSSTSSPLFSLDVGDMDDMGVTFLPNTPCKMPVDDSNFTLSKKSFQSPQVRNECDEGGQSSFNFERTLSASEWLNILSPSTKKQSTALSARKRSSRDTAFGDIFENVSPAKSPRIESPRCKIKPRSPKPSDAGRVKAAALLKKAMVTGSRKDDKPEVLVVSGKVMFSQGTQTDHWMSARMSFEQCCQEREFEYFCGLSLMKFEHLYKSLGGDAVFKYLKYQSGRPTPKAARPSRKLLSLKGKLFLTLVRLRRGFTEREISYFFGVSLSTVSRVCTSWVQVLFLELNRLAPFLMPSAAEQELTKPSCFDGFRNVRCVVDCFEVKIQRPSNFEQQGNCYSLYKSSTTAKVMVAVTTRGGICFISEAYEGDASDKQIFLNCGIVDHLEPGDAVMVDRGFTVENELRERGVRTIMPPFKHPDQERFTAADVLKTRKIANARIHVERIIGKIRHWTITTQVLPQTLQPLVSQMVYVCASLTNYVFLDL